MIACPMCGKTYSEHDLEVHAKEENVSSEYCCPHCGWAWELHKNNQKD